MQTRTVSLCGGVGGNYAVALHLKSLAENSEMESQETVRHSHSNSKQMKRSDSECSQASSDDLSASGKVPKTLHDDLDHLSDKREKHKLVERKRRDKARSYIEQLQAMIPNLDEKRPNPNPNHVLEKTLEYLQSFKLDDSSSESSKHAPAHRDLAAMKILNHVTTSELCPIDDITSRRYMLAFDSAPLGIVISRIDGVFIKANYFFRSLFRFPYGSNTVPTMFSLTSQQDLAKTLKAASTLLNGLAPRLSFTKECIRPDGQRTGLLYVDMACVWRGSQPQAFICYIRPSTAAAEADRVSKIVDIDHNSGIIEPVVVAEDHLQDAAMADAEPNHSLDLPPVKAQHQSGDISAEAADETWLAAFNCGGIAGTATRVGGSGGPPAADEMELLQNRAGPGDVGAIMDESRGRALGPNGPLV